MYSKHNDTALFTYYMPTLTKEKLRAYLLQKRKTIEYQQFMINAQYHQNLHQQIAKIIIEQVAKKRAFEYASYFTDDLILNIATYHSILNEIKISADVIMNILQQLAAKIFNTNSAPSCSESNLGLSLDSPIKIQINFFLPYAFKNGTLAFNLFQSFVLKSDQSIFKKIYQAQAHQTVLDEYRIKTILSRSIHAKKLDVVMIPSVGIYQHQGRFHRIGYGAGFYDRCFTFIQKLNKISVSKQSQEKTKERIPYILGINHDYKQYIYDIEDSAEHQAYDLVLDAVI